MARATGCSEERSAEAAKSKDLIRREIGDGIDVGEGGLAES